MEWWEREARKRKNQPESTTKISYCILFTNNNIKTSKSEQEGGRKHRYGEREQKHQEDQDRVGKCQIFYTDQYQQTRFYPGEKRVNRDIFGTSNLQNRTYGVSCDE